MIKWILDKLNLTYANEQISDLQDRFSKLEEGVMHDDYPKCLTPKNCGFHLCKHGRLTMNSALQEIKNKTKN